MIVATKVLYEGLSPQALETCLKRMERTLTCTPQRKKTRDYVRSLTGERETPAQLRARARAAVEAAAERAALRERAKEVGRNVVAKARSHPEQQCPPVRKQRVSPFAKARQGKAIAVKKCRPGHRHRPEFINETPREARGMDEMRELRVRLAKVQNGLCGICGGALPINPHLASLDHVIPRAMGGKDSVGNYVLAHKECNGEKANDVPTGCEMVWLLLVNAKMGALPVVY